jgi:gluconate 2-dehydrogenase gamma chain
MPKRDSVSTPAPNAREATLAALVDQIFPPSNWGPGARQLGLAELVWELAGSPAGRGQDSYRQPPFADADVPGLGWQWRASPLEGLEHGLDVVGTWSLGTHGAAFADLPSAEQSAAVTALDDGSFPGFDLVSAASFFDLLYGYVFDALFVVPASGGYSLDAVWDRLGVRAHPAADGESGSRGTPG